MSIIIDIFKVILKGRKKKEKITVKKVTTSSKKSKKDEKVVVKKKVDVKEDVWKMVCFLIGNIGYQISYLFSLWVTCFLRCSDYLEPLAFCAFSNF